MILAFLSEIQARYFLPDFLDGNYGEGDFKKFRRQVRKNGRS
ncbi:MAG: hypothetical protein P8Y70_12330 [Candidatus Lokiarchaeota archaeon]